MKKALILMFILVGLIPFVNGAHSSLLGCESTGKLSFTFQASTSEVIKVNDVKINLITPTGRIIDITNSGKWEGLWGTTTKKISQGEVGSSFSTGDGIVKEKGRNKVKIDYISYTPTQGYNDETEEKILDCPGLIFSCDLLGININSCSNEGDKFKADLTIKGLKPSDIPTAKVVDVIDGIDYTIEANKKYEDINGNYLTNGDLPKNYKLIKVSGDKYSLEFDLNGNIINGLRVAFTKNDDYQYFFDLDACYIKEKEDGLPNNLSSFKRCGTVNSINEPPIVDQSPVQEVNEIPEQNLNQETNEPEPTNLVIENYIPYIIIGGAIIIGLIVASFILRKKK